MRFRTSKRRRTFIINGHVIEPGPPRVRVGNWISTARYWSWRARRPRTDPLDRPIEDWSSLHPDWFDRWLLKVQDRLWR